MLQVTEDVPSKANVPSLSLLLPLFHFLLTVTGYVYLVFLPQLGTSSDSPTSGPIGHLTVPQKLWAKVNMFICEFGILFG